MWLYAKEKFSMSWSSAVIIEYLLPHIKWNKGSDIINYYDEIKETLIKNEIYKKVKDYSKNKSDLNAYFEVGRLLVEAQGGEKRAKYGNKLIK